METRDFFISYNNGKDAERAEWLARTLRSVGYSVHFQGDDCAGGTGFLDWMDSAIRHSKGFIAVWSKTYDKAPFCKEEYNAALLMQRKQKSYHIFPACFEEFRTKNVLFGDIITINLKSPHEEKNRDALLKAIKAAGYIRGNTDTAPAPVSISDDDKRRAREAYFAYLSRTLGNIQFEGMPTDQKSGAVRVPLEQIFVPLRYGILGLRKDAPDSQRNTLRNKIVHGTFGNELEIRDILTESPRAAILAKPGGGKSTLIRRIALAYADPERRGQVEDGLPDEDWFPVYLRCRDLHGDAVKSVGEMIASISLRAEMGQYQSAFRALAEDAQRDGRLLLLIDGLDEISIELARMAFVEQLHTYVETWPNIRLVVTSREAGFRTVAGTLERYCDRYSIADLNEEQIRELCRKWHEAILGKSGETTEEAERVSGTILKDARLQALAGNPLLLTTLLFVKRWVGYLPTQRCRLYQEMVKLLLVSWNAAAHEKLDLDETEPQLAYVAFSMTREGRQTITEAELKQRIMEARNAMPELLGYTKVRPAQFIELVEERSSLLIMKGLEEDRRGNMVPVYEFSHLSFQEYLTARAISENWLAEEDGCGLKELVRAHLREVQWAEVIPLAAVLCGRDAVPTVKYLLAEAEAYQENDEGDFSDDSRIYGNAAALHLANCLANEVPIGRELLEKAIVTVVRQHDSYYYVSPNKIDIITIILNAKYGAYYREIVRNRVFDELKADDLASFTVAWSYVLENDCTADLREIARLLQSEQRENYINGTLLMMLYARECWRRNAETQFPPNAEKIYPKVLTILKMKDLLSCYTALRCVAWCGYDSANIIPPEYVSPFADQLIDMWILCDRQNVLFSMITRALYNVLTPGLSIIDTPELRSAVQQNLEDGKNKYERFTAFLLGILNHQLSNQEIRHYLAMKPTWYRRRHFLRESGFTDENGNIIEEDPPEQP